MTLNEIDKAQALRYIGFKGKTPDSALLQRLDICEKRLLDTVSPRYTYKVFAVKCEEGGIRIDDSCLMPVGKDAAALLTGCDRAVLMAVTLGADVDRLIRSLEISDMAAAVITDGLASAAAEQVCDSAEKEILSAVKHDGHTPRFSPGYGDCPLDIQADFLSMINAQRLIGLCASAGGLLTPIKSVTAFIGLGGGNVNIKKSCDGCPFGSGCDFRKNGGHCGI